MSGRWAASHHELRAVLVAQLGGPRLVLVLEQRAGGEEGGGGERLDRAAGRAARGGSDQFVEPCHVDPDPLGVEPQAAAVREDDRFARIDAGFQMCPKNRQVGLDGLLARAQQLGQLRDGHLATQREQREQVARPVTAEVGAREANAPGTDLEATEELDVEHEWKLCVWQS